MKEGYHPPKSAPPNHVVIFVVTEKGGQKSLGMDLDMEGMGFKHWINELAEAAMDELESQGWESEN